MVSKIDKTIMHIFPAIGDQQAALLGSGLRKEQELSFNMGTGAQVSVLTEKLQKPEGFQIRPYFSEKYLKTIPHIPSGRALNVYVRFICDVLDRFNVEWELQDVWKGLLEAEREGKSSGMTCDLSYFENAISSKTVASLSNVGEYDLTLENLMYTVFEQMASNFIACADRIINPSQVQSIVFSGGVARKIGSLRSRILNHYDKDMAVTIARNETLIGTRDYIRYAMRT